MLSKLEYFNKLEKAIKNNQPNDFWNRLENRLKGILPQKLEPEINPIEQEIQGLKDNNYSYEDVNLAIDQDNVIQNKDEAKDFASKIYGKQKLTKYTPWDIFNIQPFEDKIGQESRQRVFNEYPFNEKTKKLLDEQTWIEEVDNKEFGGQSTPRTVLDIIPFHLGEKLLEKLPVNKFNDKIAEFLTKPTGGKNQIQLSNTGVEITTHELLHALVDKRKGFPSDRFNLEWENDKNKFPDNNSIYHFVDKIISDNKELYPENLDDFSRANERFAYTGTILGKTGVKNFPVILQKYYKGIFK